jgi:hypothetical protein
MPYNSATDAYERRSTTIIDATPDGDTVLEAIDTKLDQCVEDSVSDINHHHIHGRHYPPTASTDSSQFLKKSPIGVVSWANGVPISDAVETAKLSASDGSALVGFLQAGTGASARTVQAKLRDVVSVKDFSSVQDAITHCIASGSRLFWPEVVSVPANVGNFHSVKHYGPGGVQRGGNVFYVQPSRSRTNTLYVSPSGSSSNDGLSTSEPMTPQTACNALREYGPTLDGTWKISLAAGSYPRQTLILPSNLDTRNAIEIYGPPTGDFRTEPTAIFDGQAQNGTCAGGTGVKSVKLKDIKVKDWYVTAPAFNAGAFNGVGIDFFDSILTTENVHIENCDAGFYMKNGTKYFTKGGRISGCGCGIQELFSVTRDFKVAGSTTNRTTIQSCEFGIKAKELSTGHLDYVEFLDNTYGVHFSRGCTANLTNSIFKRNTVGVYAMAGSSIVDYSVTWGSGADANGVKFSTDASSTEIMRGGGENAQAALFTGKGAKLIGNDVTQLVHTGTLTDTLVAQFNDTAIGDFQAIGEYYEGLAYGTCVLTSAATVRFRVGGNGASSITMPTGSYVWSLRFRFTSRGPDAQIAFAELQRTNGSPVTAANARAYTFSTTSFLLGLWVQLGATGDSVTIEGAHLCTSEM